MIYITGSAGFIGKAIVQELKKSKTPCKKIKIRLKNSVSKFNSTYKKFSQKNDTLIHLGWGKMHDPWSEFHVKNNYYNSVELFKFAKKNYFEKVIFCGSMNEYGNKAGLLKESSKPSKLDTLYAKGKLKVTMFGLKFFKNSKTNFFSIRPSYVFGMNQREGTLVDLLIKAYKKKNSIKMSSCHGFRDYVYVGDVAKGIIKIALIKSKIETGIYNIGSGKCITIKKFVQTFSEVINFDNTFLKFGAIPDKKEQKHLKSFMDRSKLTKNLNWSPSVNIRAGLRQMAKFILKQ